MKLQEMRVGVFYYWNAESKNYPMRVSANDFCNDNYLNFEPIPLTEEWLVKFGCSKIGINYQIKNISIWYSSYDKCYQIRYFLVGSNVEKHINLEYVHTFQNVINTLTGEEITIKN